MGFVGLFGDQVQLVAGLAEVQARVLDLRQVMLAAGVRREEAEFLAGGPAGHGEDADALGSLDQPRVEGGMVQIKGDYTEGVFQLCVSNPCDPLAEQQPSRGTHQALANIEARLTALFGPNASLSVDRRDGRHYTCLRYPCARLMQEARAI